MFKRVVIFLFFISVAALQTALSPRIAIFGVKPDFLLIAVVVWAIVHGGLQGGFVGLAAGLLEDILSAGFYVHAFTKAIAGYLSGAFRGSFSFSKSSTYVVTVVLMTFISYLFEIISFYFFFGRQLPGFYSIVSVMFLSAIYNGVLTLVLFPFFEKISQALVLDAGAQLREYKLYRL